MSAADSARAPMHPSTDQARRTRLLEELERATAHHARVQAERDQLLADPSVTQEERDATATMLGHLRHQQLSAEQAVAQLDAGTFGRCARCDGDIGEERLAALVDVTTCVRCAD